MKTKLSARRHLHKALLLFIMLICINLSACGPKMITKGDKYPLLYEEQPVSILILPPINESTAAEAKDYYATTIQEPLSFWGYYVFPYEITTEILKMEGIYDTELLKSLPLQKFREYFGADAVLFTTIKKWDLSYLVIASNLTVSVDCELKSTQSNATLWKYNGTVTVDLSGGNTGGGLVGLVVKTVVTAVSSAMADYVPHARTANYRALQSLPYGKYHALYGKDRTQQFMDQPPLSDR
ncbi:MAG TPA: DUF799 family lipoprotein [Syntrophales bacterium]|jgi:hypothetical protein|nr:DUF799 family lipoprotein [Syntrophales bacterium]HOU76893.1 DUF799 family lipoprotein [Syntrophales bacterium]HQG34283.1 DUF799 family lipoprotein [Syntrophales bacterium]HQJ30235.1 DUF799 family lipoprotein [Syntrophales bacterium]